jgi:DNA-binding FrmR family transcriptional regulator
MNKVMAEKTASCHDILVQIEELRSNVILLQYKPTMVKDSLKNKKYDS